MDCDADGILLLWSTRCVQHGPRLKQPTTTANHITRLAGWLAGCCCCCCCCCSYIFINQSRPNDRPTDRRTDGRTDGAGEFFGRRAPWLFLFFVVVVCPLTVDYQLSSSTVHQLLHHQLVNLIAN